jgi:hypothetical protein
MRSMGIFGLGYVLFLGGILLALWKTGVLASIGSTWTAIGIVIAVGLGVMFAASLGARRPFVR